MWVTYFCLAPCRNTSVKFIYYTTLGLMKLHKSKLLLYIFLQMPAPITNYYQFYRRYEGFVDSVVSSSNLFQSCQVWKVCNTNDSKESLQNKSLKLWTTPPPETSEALCNKTIHSETGLCSANVQSLERFFEGFL